MPGHAPAGACCQLLPAFADMRSLACAVLPQVPPPQHPSRHAVLRQGVHGGGAWCAARPGRAGQRCAAAARAHAPTRCRATCGGRGRFWWPQLDHNRGPHNDRPIHSAQMPTRARACLQVCPQLSVSLSPTLLAGRWGAPHIEACLKSPSAGAVSQVQAGKLSSTSLDRYSNVALAGVVTEYLAFGQAEGGIGDILQLDGMFRALSVSI
eukprot:365625-Chlamydomonas_euryale.AAC.15